MRKNMCAADRKRAVIVKMEGILQRLQPVVKDITERDLVWHASAEEADQLKSSLAKSMKRIKKTLGSFCVPPDKEY
jgi:hypothetical protein